MQKPDDGEKVVLSGCSEVPELSERHGQAIEKSTRRGIRREAYFKRMSQNMQQRRSAVGDIKFAISEENKKILRWLNAFLRR